MTDDVKVLSRMQSRIKRKVALPKKRSYIWLKDTRSRHHIYKNLSKKVLENLEDLNVNHTVYSVIMAGGVKIVPWISDFSDDGLCIGLDKIIFTDPNLVSIYELDNRSIASILDVIYSQRGVDIAGSLLLGLNVSDFLRAEINISSDISFTQRYEDASRLSNLWAFNKDYFLRRYGK